MKMRKSTRPIQGTNTQGGHRAVDIHLNPSTKVAQRAVERDLTESTMRENGEPRTYGYIRVSSREQNVARQVVALHDFGITDECIFLDKQSGKDFNRPAYQRLIRMLQAGDVLVVKSIDRLGRNYEEILEQWRLITKEKGAAIVVLDMPRLDTRSNRDLTGTLIADIVLQLLSYVAETERAFIKQRQREGIVAAKSRGVRFGPPEKARPEGFEELAEEWRAGRIMSHSLVQIVLPRLVLPLARRPHWPGQVMRLRFGFDYNQGYRICLILIFLY